MLEALGVKSIVSTSDLNPSRIGQPDAVTLGSLLSPRLTSAWRASYSSRVS